MKRPEQEKIDKLPVWAQGYIRDMERREREAVLALDELKMGLPDSNVLIERRLDPTDKNFGESCWVPVTTDGVRFMVSARREGIEVSLTEYNHNAMWPGQSVFVSAGGGRLQITSHAANLIEVMAI